MLLWGGATRFRKFLLCAPGDISADQIAQPTEGEGYQGAFVCHCTDCRTITASMFATNFIVSTSHLKYNRGEDQLKSYGQSETIGSATAIP